MLFCFSSISNTFFQCFSGKRPGVQSADYEHLNLFKTMEEKYAQSWPKEQEITATAQWISKHHDKAKKLLPQVTWSETSDPLSSQQAISDCQILHLKNTPGMFSFLSQI